MRPASLALRGCLLSCPAAAPAALAQPAPRLDVPVMVGGEEELDGCASAGRIAGLDPRGDGFLSVRSGPGGRPYREIDRLHNGNEVIVCDERGPWLGIVYGGAANADCGVGTPWPLRKPYAGPCRFGWVHSRYVRIVAG